MRRQFRALSVIAVILNFVGAYGQASEDDIRLSAEQGDARSQYALGQMLAEGQGVEVNSREAVKWLESAADQRLGLAVVLYACWN